MYKRPVRILFAGPEAVALRACYWTTRLADGLAEAQCTTVLTPAPAALGWADLLVIVGETPCASDRPGLTIRRWLPPRDTVLDEWLQDRIAGVLGGIRLLAQLDAEDSSG